MAQQQSDTPPAATALDAIVLAAGKGTRMNSDLPKVLHEVAGEPMVKWVIAAARQAGADRIIVVVGYRSQLVREALADQPGVEFVEQTEQLGTGHAVQMAEPLYRGVAGRDVLVLAGDMPLLRGSTLVKLLARHRAQSAAASVATGELEDPAGYGRIVRDAAGAFERIVEHKDATDAQRAIREVNPSCYCFDSARLFEALAQVDSNNSQGEFYVTDVLGILREAGHTVIAVNAVGPDEVEGINSPEQLARVDQTLRQRQDEGAAP